MKNIILQILASLQAFFRKKTILGSVCLVILVACSPNNEELILGEEVVYEVTNNVAYTEIEELEEPIKTMNPLTGIYYEGEKNFFPVAVVINNIPAALPQSGISEADIIYEVLAEGGITRLIAIFTNSEAEKIGPIRSTREYFADIANNWNAPLVHHGGSPAGYDRIRQLGLTTLDGFYLENRYFWRRGGRPREHSSYTNWDNITTFLRENSPNHFNPENNSSWNNINFSNEDTIRNSTKVEINEVVITFSHAHQTKFVLQDDTFKRYQRGEVHIDEFTGEQVEVHNLLIKRAAHSPIPNDPEGRINVNVSGNGTGYLVTKDGYEEITWVSSENGTIWLDLNGNDISLNRGNTWISIIGTNQNVELINNEHESEM